MGDDIGATSIKSGPDVLIYTILRLVIGLLGIVLSVLLLLTFCINRAFHPNLKIISGCFIFSILMNAVVTVSETILRIMSIKATEAFLLYYINSFCLVFSANLWQCVFFTFTVERTVATIRNENYESHKSCYFGIILALSAVS